jgi:phycocyanobilin lyase beta subunit
MTFNEMLKAIEDADSAVKLADAVKLLAQSGSLDAIPHLIRALGYNNPGAAVASVDGLIAIGEPAVLPLLELLDGYNYSARAWALRALSGIGDPRSLSLLLDTAQNDFALSVRRAAARGLGTIKWEQMADGEVMQAQAEVLQVLLVICGDPEWVVRYSAITGVERLLAGLGEGSVRDGAIGLLSKLAIEDEDLTVRSRAALAGWRSDSLETRE